MKLRIYAEGSRRGTSYYVIEADDREHNKPDRPEVGQKIQELGPRIEAMARKHLGDNFISLEFHGGEILFMSVRVGTSQKMKFEFRDLCGWVNLFDDE